MSLRILRFLGLVLAITAVYLGQSILLWGIPTGLLPGWLLDTSPVLLRLARWRAEDLQTIAWILGLGGFLLFALVAPLWHGETLREYRPNPTTSPAPARSRLIPSLLIFAGLAILACISLLSIVIQPPIYALVAFAAAIPAYGTALLWAWRARPRASFRRAEQEPVRPYRAWPWLFIFLMLILGLLVYQAQTLPVALDHAALIHAQAATMLLRNGSSMLDFGPILLLLPSYLLSIWLPDLFTAGALRGFLAAVSTLAGIWLLACEWFRRTPMFGRYGERIEDDGRFPALLTLFILPALLPFYHYARLPFILEPVGLGLLSLWCISIGTRNRNIFLIGCGGLLAGLPLYYGLPGIIWFGLGVLLWIGIALFHRSRFTGRWIDSRPKDVEARGPVPAAPVMVEEGLGWRVIFWWMGGAAVTLTPFMAYFLRRGAQGGELFAWLWPLDQFTERVQFAGSFQLTESIGSGSLLLANPSSQMFEASRLIAESWPVGLDHVAGVLLAPMLLLALGALLFNLDHLLGWMLGGWLLLGIVPLFLLNPALALWPALLACSLPAAALLVAFALDRARLALLQSLGSWAIQATTYAVVGLVFAALSSSTVHYIEDSFRYHMPESELVRRLPTLLPEDTRFFVADAGRDLVARTPIVALLWDEWRSSPARLSPESWPDELPNGTTVLLAGEDYAWLPALRRDFGPGRVEIVRNLRGDPVLVVYRSVQ